MTTVSGSEASNTVISWDAAEILHPHSVITSDQVKLFRDLNEDYSNFREKVRNIKSKFPECLQPLSPWEPAIQDSSTRAFQGGISPDDKSKDSIKGETKQGTFPVYRSLASKLGLSGDDMRKYTEFLFVVPALNFYNKQNGTNFKLVDTTHSRLFYFGGMWAHCVFQVGLPDSCYTKIFFAEVLRRVTTHEYEVKTVRALIDSNYFKCPACEGLNIPHPRDFVSEAYSCP